MKPGYVLVARDVGISTEMSMSWLQHSRSDGGRAMPMQLSDLPMEGSAQLRGQLPLDDGVGPSDRLDAMDMWRPSKVSFRM